MATAQPTPGLPLFFKALEAVDTNRHKALRVQRKGYQWTAITNAIPVAYTEMLAASREYPLVFAGSGANQHMVAVVGFMDGQNLMVADDGSWRGRYLPAYIRCYPFCIARHPDAGENQFTLGMDPQAEDWSVSDGNPLFTADGKESPFLTAQVELLRNFQAQGENMRLFVARLQALNLLENVDATARLNDGKEYKLSGLQVVDRQKLRALSAEARATLDTEGWLEGIYHHLGSLENFHHLTQMLGEAAAKKGMRADSSVQ